MPRKLSLDEPITAAATSWTDGRLRPDRRCVLEVIDGRTRGRLERYLRSISVADREAIEVVSSDAYDTYRQAVKAILPHATVVCDPFHLVRGANTALDTVMRERQRMARSERGKGDRRAGGSVWRHRSPHRLLKAGAALGARPQTAL
jgi:transposase